VAASTQVDARLKAFQRRFQSLNFLREKQSDIVRRRAWCGLMEIENLIRYPARAVGLMEIEN
jgi:hypothetical protein